MRRVILARADLVAALRSLEATPGAVAVAPAATSRFQGAQNVLAGGPFIRRRAAVLTDPSIAIRRTEDGDLGQPLLLDHLPTTGSTVVLSYQSTAERLVLDGVIAQGDRHLVAIDELMLVGAGMECFQPGTMRSTVSLVPPDERFSRVVGALTHDVWSRLVTLRIGIVGCGRAGATLGILLEDLGVCSFVLIDPDIVEAHNLGPLYGRVWRDRGRPKVDALAEALWEARRASTDPNSLFQQMLEIRAVPASVTTFAALDALLDCDLIVTTTDHDGARAYCSLIGQVYLKPVLDIGTGVRGHGPERDMGATVRIAIPGESCLHCHGGFANWEQIRAILGSAEEERESRTNRVWQQERAGSLPNLNLSAIGQGVTWLQDLVGQLLAGARLMDLVIDQRSEPALRTTEPDGQRGCPFCRLRGRGDAGRRQGLQQLRHLARYASSA